MAAGQRTVFLTGGTGAWGRATIRAFRERGDEFRVLALLRPGSRNAGVFREFSDWPGLEVLPGDLTSPSAIAAGVSRADVVLHMGALVSPAADSQPARTLTINLGSVQHIISAVRALPDPSRVAVIGVGSIAEEGSRRPPHHWSRIGDPVRMSIGDVYGKSKILGERELAESGLPRWTWLRQTGIIHPDMARTRDPIMTHPTLDGVMEWASEEDSARLAVALSAADVPAKVWGGTWHVGGGEAWRMTNWDFLQATAVALGIGDIRRWYDRNWFALRNFHGSWFTDSDRLDDLVPFRQDTVAAAFARAGAAFAPIVRRLAGAFAPIGKQFVIRRLAMQPRGTLGAVKRGDEAEIAAFFGSIEAWREIGDWTTFSPPQPSRTPTLLDHGYDEDREPPTWDASLYRDAAEFRGGALAVDHDDVPRGQVTAPLTWTCADGHRFTASPRLVLQAGHWCSECVLRPEDYSRQAERNAFLAQVLD